MAASLFRSLLAPLRVAVARFARDPESRHEQYTATHGCLRVGASHIAWNSLAGDYLEFGVFNGLSFIEAFQAIEWHRAVVHSTNPQIHDDAAYRQWRAAPPRMVAFDSFEGLPASEGAGHNDYFQGSYSCSEAQFLVNVKSAGVPIDRVITVKGFYDSSLTPEARERLGLEGQR